MMQIRSQISLENSWRRLSFFANRSTLQWTTVVLIFTLAFAIRVYKLAIPTGAIDREFRSAVIARAYYLRMTDSVPDWRRDVATASEERAGVIEPPIMELLASSSYRIVNGEHLWLARFLASMFWIVGGVFLLKVVERLVSFEAAVFSTAYYLFAPLGVYVSRSLQPDSLMIMLFLICIFAIIRYFDQPTMRKLAIAALLSGITILIRPLVLFTLLSAFISLTILRKVVTIDSYGGHSLAENGVKAKIFRLHNTLKAVGGIKWIFDAQTLIFIVVSLFPAAVFYAYGAFFTDAVAGQVGMKFLPQLLLSPDYWRGWLQTAVGSVGYAALIAALVGLPLMRSGKPKALLIGLWIGYVLFGLAFHIQIHFVDYYHLQLIVIVALSFAPLIALLINHLRPSLNRWYWGVYIVAVIVLVLLFNFRQVRSLLAARQFAYDEALAWEIGEIVQHSQNTVYLAPHYGTLLEYYGELSGTFWPERLSDQEKELGRLDVPGRTVEERFQSLGFTPEYFIINDLTRFHRHHADLKEYLVNNCRLVAESDQYLIYRSCTSQF